MSKQVSIAEARARLPSLVRAAEQGRAVEITRRGKPVAVLVPRAEYVRMTSSGARLVAALDAFRAKHDLSRLDVAGALATVRDRDPGRTVKW